MLPLRHIEFRNRPRLLAHTGEEFGAFGDADGAARVEQVEGLALAQHVVVGRGDQSTLDTGVGLGLVDGVERLEPFDIGQFEVVDAVLDLGRRDRSRRRCGRHRRRSARPRSCSGDT